MREDLPRAKVEQELEALRYQSYVQQQFVIFASFKDRYYFIRDTFIVLKYSSSFFFAKGTERCGCREAGCAFSGARGEAERARIARDDEITVKNGR